MSRSISSLFSFDRSIYLILIATICVACAGVSMMAWSVFGQTAPERSSDVRIQVKQDGRYRSNALIVQSPADPPEAYVSSYTDYDDRHKDIRSLTLEVYSISQEQLLSFLSYEIQEGEYGQEVIGSTLDLAGMKPVATITRSQHDPRKAIQLPIADTGIWFVRATVNNKRFNDVVFMRSDLAAVAKEQRDDYVFWAQRTGSGQRQEGGTLQLFDLESRPQQLGAASLNNNGIAETAIRENADIAYLTAPDGQQAVVPLNMPQGRYYYRGWDQFAPAEYEGRYYLYTDRPLYSPGDTIQFSAIVREDMDSVYRVPQSETTVRIYNDEQHEQPVFEHTYVPDEMGVVSGEYTLPKGAATGEYSVTIDRSPEGEGLYDQAHQTQIRVERFRKPDYTLTASSAQKVATRGDDVTFDVSGAYLFGQPLAGEDVSISLKADDAWLSTRYRRDVQSMLSYEHWGGHTVDKKTITLDEQGKGSVSFDTSMIDWVSEHGGTVRSRVVTLEAAYNDESGNRVVDTSRVFVWPSPYRVERPPEAPYSVATRAEYPLSFTLRALGVDRSVGDVPVTINGEREYWERVTENGRTSYNHTTEEFTLTARTDANGKVTTPVDLSRPGRYTFSIETQDGKAPHRGMRFSMWVYEREQDADAASNKPFHVMKSRSAYEVGETAELTVTTKDFPRDALLTIERGHTRRFRVISLTEAANHIPVSMTDTDIPNVFATVSGFTEQGFQNASEKLPVDTSPKELRVDIKPERRSYAPGETVRMSVTTRDQTGSPVPANVTVWALDKALLELREAERGPIIEHFWDEQFNDTETAHSFEGIAMRGGGAEKGCFVGSTPVRVPDGTKPIKNIKEGDRVMTRPNADSDDLVAARVTDTHTKTVDGYLIINDRLKVTPAHRLRVNGKWLEAGKIQTGDTLTTADGERVSVRSIAWQRSEVTVHNLTVATHNTYIANGVWVHNQKGGGGGEARSVFKDVAYWNPRVRTGNDGKATVTFSVPDNLTTWVVNGVGVTTETQVGEARRELVVNKPVVTRPILPNILRTGDAFALNTLVHNYTGTPQEFATQCRIADTETPTKHAAIKQGDLTSVQFGPITASEADSTHEVTCRARGDQTGEDAVTRTLPVKPFGFEDTRSHAGVGSSTYKLSLHEDTDPEHSSVRVTLTPSVFGTLPNAMTHLIEYPYGCVEQTTSRFVPAVIAQENRGRFADFLDNTDVNGAITEGITRLAKLKSGRGWGWWHGDTVNPLITAYVFEYLTRARALGYEIPDHLLNDPVRLAKEKLSVNDQDAKQRKSLPPYERVAFAYILVHDDSSYDVPRISNLDALSTDVLSLAVMVNAASGITDPAENGVSELMDRAITTNEEAREWPAGRRDFFGSRDASTGLAIRALTEANASSRARGAVSSLARNRDKHYWSNTFATAQILDGLTSFAQRNTVTSDPARYRVRLNGAKIARGTLQDPFEADHVSIDPDRIGENAQLSVTTEGGGTLFSTVTTNDFRTSRTLSAAENGISIKRRYDGVFAPGETVEVVLTVSGMSPMDSEQLVIEDHLPAGLVPVNPDLENTKERQYDHYWGEPFPDGFDVRDDGVTIGYRFWDGETFTARYRARVVSRGTYTAPPARASLMYEPDIHGRSAVDSVRIGDVPPDPQKRDAVDHGLIITAALAFLILVLIAFGVYVGWNIRSSSADSDR